MVGNLRTTTENGAGQKGCSGSSGLEHAMTNSQRGSALCRDWERPIAVPTSLELITELDKLFRCSPHKVRSNFILRSRPIGLQRYLICLPGGIRGGDQELGNFPPRLSERR
jgi:hypothetical protein